MEKKRYKVNFSYGQTIEAESEKEAEAIFWDLIDSCVWKADVTLL